MKTAVLTSMVGTKGNLQDPSNGGFSNVDYIAFVDRPHNFRVWNQRGVHKFSTTPLFQDRRNAKLPKMLGWALVPGYDLYIWHDSIFELAMNPQEIADKFLPPGVDMALWRHPARDCAYHEADIVVQVGFETFDLAEATKKFLREQSWPPHAGLFEMCSFVYRPTFRVQQALLAWWELTTKYSSRDQLTWPYVRHAHNINFNYLPGLGTIWAGNPNNPVIPQVR